MESETHIQENFQEENFHSEQNREEHSKEDTFVKNVEIPFDISEKNEEIPQDITSPDECIAKFDRDAQQLKEKLLIIQADFDNFRKRSARDQEDIRRFACAAIIEELLPILDNFETGLKSVQIDKNMLSGFQMIFSQLQALLIGKGVKEIVPMGDVFDPLQQEAVAYIFHDEISPECVVETVRKGYLLNDRLLRPASVIVSKGKSSEEK